MSADRDPFLVLVNPVSGGGRGAILAGSLAAVFEKFGARAQVVALPAPGAARSEIENRGGRYRAVVAVGGDGTVNEVAAAVHNSGLDRAIGLIPLGLSNCLARHLHVPLDPEEAVRTMIEGQRKRIGLVLMKDRIATAFVGAGFDAAIVKRVAAVRTGTVTNRDYVRAGLKAFLDTKWPRINVEVDGRKIKGNFFQAIVCSISNYAHYIDVPTGPGFRIYLFAGRNRLNLWRSFLRLGKKPDLARACDVSLPVKEKVIFSVESIPGFYQFDGEYGGPLPVDCYIKDQALEFMVPA